MAHVKRVPYLLFFKFYGFRLLIISIIWFLYDFSTYSFGLYANSILSSIYGDEEQPLLTTIYGWNTASRPKANPAGPLYTNIVFRSLICFICQEPFSAPSFPTGSGLDILWPWA